MNTSGRAEEALADYELSRIPVRERPRFDYEPIGYRIGPIFFYPRLTAGLRYDSNVLATSVNPRADLAFVISPGLKVRSTSERYSYELDLGADIYRFRELTSEDRVDAHARHLGRAELGGDFEIATRLEAARRHEERGEASTPINAASPVPYTDLLADFTLTKSIDRSGISFNAGARRLDYEDVDSIEGAVLDQGWRSGTIFSAFLKPYYEFSPGYRAFVRVGGNTRDYEGTGTLDRDSRGYDVRGGLDFAFTPLLLGTVEAGYLNQSYNNPAISTINGLSFAGDVKWLFTPLMTVTFKGERRIAEATTPGFGSRIDTSAGVQVDYELLRNVILFAGARYMRQDFADPGRKDDVIRATAGVDYLMNRYLRVGARYEFTDRNSSIPAFSFDRHVVMFNATAQR